MKIAIIGAGNIGTLLVRKLAAQGHTIKVANSKGPETLAALAAETGATAVSKEDAFSDIEVIIISIPFSKTHELVGYFKTVPAEVTVIDTSNYYPHRDGNIAELDDGKLTESEWVIEQLGRPVIKAWNAVLAYTLETRGKPAGSPGRIALPVSGDDVKDKAIATQLVQETGFDVVDVGSIAESWRHQPGSPAYCTELSTAELTAALSAATRNRLPENRDSVMKSLPGSAVMPIHDEMIALMRKLNK
jgi:predicted dinucleotide-binding enzyme